MPIHPAFKKRLQQATPAYAQLATTLGGRAIVRTVHIKWVAKFGVAGFITHNDSAKWRQLKNNPAYAACLYDAATSIQWRLSGRAKLLKPNRHNQAVFLRLWQAVRAGIRNTYLQDARLVQQGLPDNLGLVLLPMQQLEIFLMDPVDYSKSQRTLYLRHGQRWVKQSMPLLR